MADISDSTTLGRLVSLHGDISPAEHILADDICTLGRSHLCQIVVQRQVVSRLHAKIERDGPRYVLLDAGSANGTFVNNRRIREPYMLQDRDVIGLGSPTALLRYIDPDPTLVSTGQLRYDEHRLRFYYNQIELELTPSQFRLLLHLYQHAGNLCTRESCAEAIWGRDYEPGVDADALDRAINTLRGKLRQADKSADLITTRRGLGYELVL